MSSLASSSVGGLITRPGWTPRPRAAPRGSLHQLEDHTVGVGDVDALDVVRAELVALLQGCARPGGVVVDRDGEAALLEHAGVEIGLGSTTIGAAVTTTSAGYTAFGGRSARWRKTQESRLMRRRPQFAAA